MAAGFRRRWLASLPIGLAVLGVWISRHPEFFRTTPPALPDVSLPEPPLAPPVRDPSLATAPEANPGPARVSLKVGPHIEHTLSWVRADVLPSRLRLVFSHAHLDCGLPLPSEGARVELELGSGPGGSFFAGHPVGVPIDVFAPERSTSGMRVGPEGVELQLEPFEAREGAAVTGSLRLDYVGATGQGGAVERWNVGGVFTTTLCSASSQADPPPIDVPDTRVGGEIGGLRIEPNTALAMVTPRSEVSDRPVLESIRFLAEHDVSCEDAMDGEYLTKVNAFDVDAIGAAFERPEWLGTAQPADAYLFSANERARWFRGERGAWVILDRADLRAGGEVAGRLFARNAPDPIEGSAGTVQGTFVARVCTYGP